jgi:hypothetical protein
MSTLFQQPSCSGRDREPQDKTHWTAEMPPTSPRLPRDAVSGAPSSYRQPFRAQASQEGKPTEVFYSVPASCPPISTNYISTTTLVSLSNSSTMKHDHKTDRISDLRGLITVIASASCL